jgi:hypothetical protein
MFFSGVASTWIQPLARGRGAKGAAAAEARRATVRRQRTGTLRRDASEQVLRSVLAYLNLIGAQERVRLVEESLARRRDSAADHTRVAAGGVAQVETERVRARETLVPQRPEPSTTDLLHARLAVADVLRHREHGRGRTVAPSHSPSDSPPSRTSMRCSRRRGHPSRHAPRPTGTARPARCGSRRR